MSGHSDPIGLTTSTSENLHVTENVQPGAVRTVTVGTGYCSIVARAVVVFVKAAMKVVVVGGLMTGTGSLSMSTMYARSVTAILIHPTTCMRYAPNRLLKYRLMTLFSMASHTVVCITNASNATAASRPTVAWCARVFYRHFSSLIGADNPP